MTVVAVLGPTASGKSDLAIELAKRIGGEIVSVDSMQVYRGMDIGTAKATPQMRRKVAHHMLDIRDPEVDMSVAEFQEEGRAALAAIADSGRIAVVCGGSGLHFRALVDPLHFPPHDPELRAALETMSAVEARGRLLELDADAGSHVDMANPRRVVRALEIAVVTGLTPSMRSTTVEAKAVRDYVPQVDFVAIGLDPGPALGDMVTARFEAMLAAGLLGEVTVLQPRLGKLASQAVGYKELLPVVSGTTTLEEGRAKAVQATRALAKRQRTFFRRDPRIHWVPWTPDPVARFDLAIEYLNEQVAWIS